jgi:hypothetical protein
MPNGGPKMMAGMLIYAVAVITIGVLVWWLL